MQTALITPTATAQTVTQRDPKGIGFINKVGAIYDKAGLSEDEAQLVNQAPGLSELIRNFIAENRVPNKYKDQEVRSKYTYPKEYKGPRPIEEQIKTIAQALGLNPAEALEFAKNLPDFKTFVPEYALPHVGWFAIPSVDAIATKHFHNVVDSAERNCRAILFILDNIAATRSFHNWRKGQITKERLRISERTEQGLVILAQIQKGDILVIAAQLGMTHRGRSTLRAEECFAGNEYGFTSVMGGSVARTHPERFVRFEELDMDLLGELFDDPDSGVRFGDSPYLGFSDDGLKFGTGPRDDAAGIYGTASFFLPQVAPRSS